jgi:hypothetical protein
MYDAVKEMKLLQSETLNEALMKVNRKGISGPLSFDSSGQVKNNVVTCIYKEGEFVEL